MHRMNANTVSADGTTTLDNGAMKRIASKMETSQAKRTKKHAVREELVAGPVTTTIVQEREATRTIKIASVFDVPKDFEKMGTGFYREGHHLWEMTPSSEGGFVLTRKRNEDHVLGYEQPPIVRETAANGRSHNPITDRRGRVLRTGNKVMLPHRGKVVAGTIVVIQPGSMNVELDGGGKVDTPPDICELLHEEMSAQPVEEGIEAKPPMIETDSAEEAEEEVEGEPEADKEGEAPETVASPDYTSTQETQPPGGEEFTPGLEPSSKADEGSDVEATEAQPGQASEPMFETEEEEEPPRTAKKASMSEPQNLSPVALNEWRAYWAGIGQRIAQRAKGPKKTKQELAEQRKMRRQQRSQERSGLPKGMKVPPKSPKMGAAGTDDLAAIKERLRLLQQCFDEIEYILEDESLRTDETRLADEMDRVMQDYHQQLEEMDGGKEQELEDEISIEVPTPEKVGPTEPAGAMPKLSKKTISMGDLSQE